ncbi:MAG: LUD domain-containing protein [Actinomycetia bacterium]|nr:LUD domain-containing protein [Actinomycetes bacterium]
MNASSKIVASDTTIMPDDRWRYWVARGDYRQQMTAELASGWMIDGNQYTMRRFFAAAVAAGCEVEYLPVLGIADLELADDAVISSGALGRYPQLAPKAILPRESPLMTFSEGVVAGELGVAETGSVLVVENELSDRLVSMMSEHLTVLLAADVIEDRLDAATAWLSAARPVPTYVVLLTGPSRTADIERSLTIGVQGPSTTRVIIVEEEP